MPDPQPPRRSAPATPAPEPTFEGAPQWIHESVAVLLGGRREARRKAILRLLDRLPIGPRAKPPSGLSR